MIAGRAREMGLSPLAVNTLAAARAKAVDARTLRHEGIDPIEAWRTESSAATARRGQGDYVQAVRRKFAWGSIVPALTRSRAAARTHELRDAA